MMRSISHNIGITTDDFKHTYRFNRVVSSILKLLDIVDDNAMLLENFEGLINGIGLFQERSIKESQ